ncbi:Putative ribonuclease H protein At1g65750 [Linum grandiflorum]
MAAYWMSIFVLPQSVIKQVEDVCSHFVWNPGGEGRKKARVSWRNLTYPVREGGVGVRDLRWWNVACTSRHLWSILLCSGSIWVAWISLYRLRRVSVWEHSPPASASWVWKKILWCRTFLLPHITQTFDRTFLWGGRTMAKYSVSRVWSSVRVRKPEVPWWRVVWSEPTIPRYSFISWQILLDRLPLSDKLIRWGIGADPACCLCVSGIEGSTHLFVTCPYISCLRSRFFPRPFPPFTWDEEISWMLVSFPALSPSSRAANLAWRCMVSHVWKERCRRVFSGQQLDVLQLGRRICWELSSVKCNSDLQQHISLYSELYR